jgi:ubiquinol-cytochrome c reductase iron-sulfur subunit
VKVRGDAHGDGQGKMSDRRPPARGFGIAVAFGLSCAASLGLAVIYVLGGQVQIEGLLLGISLGGLGGGLIMWAKGIMPEGPYVEAREQLSKPEERAEAAGSLVRGEREIERRGFLGKLLGAAVACLGVAAVFPIRSLGARPGTALLHTSWTNGTRLVTLDEVPVRPERLDVGGVLTVFPENAIDAADSQVLLIRIDASDYDPLPGREDWAPEGYVGFSKICTHAGCPVGLYQAATHQLVCPCHQSVFDVLAAAASVEGPATRRLPQLPLAIDADGFVIATGDFPEPVGPGFWDRPDA